jgi:hypothetical protein
VFGNLVEVNTRIKNIAEGNNTNLEKRKELINKII